MRGGTIIGSFTRPGDTTAYGSGDLIANSTTAASVVPIAFTHSGGVISDLRIRKSTNVTTNANVRLWLFSLFEGQAAPTVTNGDNGALAFSSEAGLIGRLTAASMEAIGAGAWARMAIDDGGTNYPRYVIPAGVRLIGFLEARAAYGPGSAEVFTIYGVAE
jgi:hypothetical protein